MLKQPGTEVEGKNQEWNAKEELKNKKIQERKKAIEEINRQIIKFLEENSLIFLLQDPAIVELKKLAEAVIEELDLNDEEGFQEIKSLFEALQAKIEMLVPNSKNQENLQEKSDHSKTNSLSHANTTVQNADFSVLTKKFQEKAQQKSIANKSLACGMGAVSALLTTVTALVTFIPLFLFAPLYPELFEKAFKPVENCWNKTDELWARGNTRLAFAGKLSQIDESITDDTSSKKESNGKSGHFWSNPFAINKTNIASQESKEKVTKSASSDQRSVCKAGR